ncbi:MAG: LytTR family transcriptional regulator DNA-binding domain-containing protein, partial [Prevotella sp.]|nr:LytTR family transcriptional regulator DNA-binding domain-containing protein [Prevotella sp.]
TMNLAHCQQTIEQQLGKEANVFIRIGKQLIINKNYIFKINVSRQELWMSDEYKNMSFKLSASKEALKQLKSWLESQAKEVEL